MKIMHTLPLRLIHHPLTLQDNLDQTSGLTLVPVRISLLIVRRAFPSEFQICIKLICPK